MGVFADMGSISDKHRFRASEEGDAFTLVGNCIQPRDASKAPEPRGNRSNIAINLHEMRPNECLVSAQFCSRGHWTPAEDAKLKELVSLYGPQNWNAIAEKLQGRSGISKENF